jgi:hypothetical protein
LSDTTEAINLADTRVPIFIPLAVIGIFACAQFYFGTSLTVMTLCAIAVATPLLPLHFYGRDLYSMMGVIFCLKYAGVGLLAKTGYGQPLEEHLFQPVYSYALTALAMVALTGALFVARSLDRGTRLFALPTESDLPGLRRLSIFGLVVGLMAQFIVGANLSTETGSGGAGGIVIIFHLISSLFFLGLVCEVIYGVTKSGGRGFITPLLAFMTGLTLLISVALNWREFFGTGLIALAATAFMYKAIRPRHILGGMVVAYFFLTFLSPITLYLRTQREGLERTRFIALALSTFERAATDPAFFAAVKSMQLSGQFQNMGDGDFDYYGDRNNALNRFSYIALLDTISTFSQTAPPIGWKGLGQSVARNMPSAFVDKSMTIYGAGDWLSWQIGMGTYGHIGFANFALPMEGLASWGVIGLAVYPFIFIVPVLFLFAKVSSLKTRLPFSIFIFIAHQHSIVEGTSDYFIGAIIKDVATFAIMSGMIYFVLFKKSAAERLQMSAASLPSEPG